MSAGAYLGCYVDQEDARDFPYVMTWSDLTPQKCIRHCADLGYAYAGLQYAVECFCGDSYGTYGPAPESDCHHACSGGGAHACGGGWRNSVWSTGAAVLTEDQLELVFEDNFDTLDLSKWQPEITAGGGGTLSAGRYGEKFLVDGVINLRENMLYLGCYHDGGSLDSRDLSGDRMTSADLTPRLCLDHCSAGGCTYAGLQYVMSNMFSGFPGAPMLGYSTSCLTCFPRCTYVGLQYVMSNMFSGFPGAPMLGYSAPMPGYSTTRLTCFPRCTYAGLQCTYAGLQYVTSNMFSQVHLCWATGTQGRCVAMDGKNSIYTSAGGRCTLENWNGCYMAGSPSQHLPPVLSARITTARSFSFRYGKVEVQAKMPTGDWIWPAIWLLPQAWVYGDWPKSGEIDIVETRGNRNLYASWGASLGVDVTTSTLHWGPSGVWPYNGFIKTRAEKEAHTGTYGSDFHNWTMVWTDQYLKFSVDDEVMLTVSPPHGFWALGDFGLPDSDNPWIGASRLAPFDQDFYLIMNVATGGTNGFFMDDYVNMPYPKPWSNSQSRSQAMEHFWQARHQWLPTWDPNANNGEDAAMQVKSVKVWKFRDL
ncbi:hypothetical protein Bbelb_197440 [Branchiostoma belcheri]|nr:hypothetical protein Bbelb_197440 [Branchiostoma belcheri]